jgi:protein required for attachment to host cells
MEHKQKEVNGYINGKKVAKNLVLLALEQNKMLGDVKKELKAHFPEIIFRQEEK